MEVKAGTREFTYNGVVLKDPGPQYSLEQCREIFANLYPEIVNAAIEGPEVKGSKTVYEFRKAVGTKGAKLPLRARVASMIAARSPEHGVVDPSKFHNALAGALHLDRDRDVPWIDEARGGPLSAPALPSALPLLP